MSFYPGQTRLHELPIIAENTPVDEDKVPGTCLERRETLPGDFVCAADAAHWRTFQQDLPGRRQP
ncbi:MAG: hypothetical protein AAF357_09515 [Verrucomicrobiota bacterium]